MGGPLPEWIYESGLSEKDITSWPVNMVMQRNSASAAAVSVEATYTVPADRVLFLASSCVEGIAGSGQTVLEQSLRVFDDTGASVVRLKQESNKTNQVEDLNYNEEVIIPGGFGLSGFVGFNNGTNSNTARLNVVGWLGPVGFLRR